MFTKLLYWLIDIYCLEQSEFGDSITITKNKVLFTGSWCSRSKNLKGAIMQSGNIFWKLCFFIFPNNMYDKIVSNLFERITIKKYDYTPESVQLYRNNRSSYKENRFWQCITNREQCYIKKSENKSVITCLKTIN